MVKAPTGYDLALTGAEVDTTSREVPIKVRTLIENTPEDIEFNIARDEVADDIWSVTDDLDSVDGEDLLTIIDQLGEVIRDNLTQLVVGSQPVYYTGFGPFLRVSTALWMDIFGTPSKPLKSWEPIWEIGEAKFISTYQINSYDRDHGEDLSTFESLLNDDNEHILPLRLTPALALSEVGYLSLSQAQAFILRRWGYETPAIADILDKPTGTVSSHLNRAKTHIQRGNWMSQFSDGIGITAPTDYRQIIRRVGNTYEDVSGDWERITGIAKAPSDSVYEADNLLYTIKSVHGERVVSVEEFVEHEEHTPAPLEDAPSVIKNADIMDVEAILNPYTTE